MSCVTVGSLSPGTRRAEATDPWFRPWTVGGALWLVALGGTAAWADPIAYAGYSLAHSPEDLQARLEGQGYGCDISIGLVLCIGPEGQLVTAASLTGDEGAIDMLAVSCQALDSCLTPADDMALMLGAALLPDGRMEIARPPVGESLATCGVGPDGDSLCLGYEGTVTFFSAALGAPRAP